MGHSAWMERNEWAWKKEGKVEVSKAFPSCPPPHHPQDPATLSAGTFLLNQTLCNGSLQTPITGLCLLCSCGLPKPFPHIPSEPSRKSPLP